MGDGEVGKCKASRVIRNEGRRSERLLSCWRVALLRCDIILGTTVLYVYKMVQSSSESSWDKDVYPSIFQKPVEEWSSAQLDAVKFLKLEEHATLIHLDRFDKE